MKERAVCIHCYYIVYLKPNYDNTEKRLRWQLPRIFVDYRCKLAGKESLDPHFSKIQVSRINTENMRHKTFHSFCFVSITTLRFKLLLHIFCDNGLGCNGFIPPT